MKPISPTPYPDVNEILDFLLTNVKQILLDQFVGMYLFGSLANGDFDEHSDIDVLIVTDSDISDAAFSSLQNLHKEINTFESPWAIQVEASYIPRDALRRFDPTNKLHPHMDRGNDEVLHLLSHESDWIIQRHILRERGIVITGPDLKNLVDPISLDELRQAVVNALPYWATPILNDPTQMHQRGYQSFIVLSLCRMLYTIQYGTIVSKRIAAQWGQETLGEQWTTLIQRALIGRQNSGLKAQAEDVNGTLAFIRYTMEAVNAFKDSRD